MCQLENSLNLPPTPLCPQTNCYVLYGQKLTPLTRSINLCQCQILFLQIKENNFKWGQFSVK